ncbi:hypothetical protein [Epinotia aporema granulovirus]|uniref:Bro-N domain-containing protein n=1 Tax=Epinotia aporema granulovirus TaxID=166056 RepID=K4ERV0_9BBAC|nr:hypothetical protein [Epinotia aporema granulovirus]AER41520.1 hypothetical protein [Epinotia aporema granulovirus]
MLVYYKDTHPLLVLYISENKYFFKLKHLLRILQINEVLARKTIPAAHLIPFHELQKEYPYYKERIYPTTTLVTLRGIFYLGNLCSEWELDELHAFIKSTINPEEEEEKQEEEEEEEEEETAVPQVTVGVLPQNIEFISAPQRVYYKARDVCNAMGATPTYTLNKHVKDIYLVVWKDLKMYLENKHKIKLENKWKNNTVFIKSSGLQHLLIVTNNKPLLATIMNSVKNYNTDTVAPYIKAPRRNRQREIVAEDCLVGKIYNKIDFVMPDNLHIYCKLKQIKTYYNIKNQHYNCYRYTKSWSQIQRQIKRCNIKWHPATLLINEEGVYNLLMHHNYSTEATNFYMFTANEIKNKMMSNSEN